MPGDRGSSPDPWSAEGLRLRLDQLSAAHPSSPRYQGGRFNRPANLRALEVTDEQIAELAARREPGARDYASGADHGSESGDAATHDDDHTMSSGWDEAGVASHPDRPKAAEIRLPEDRRVHILEGDGPGSPGGGHRHGTGRPGKTEFPAGWDDDKIVSVVEDVTRSPDTVVWQGFNSRWRVTGDRDSVTVTSIVRPDGKILERMAGTRGCRRGTESEGLMRMTEAELATLTAGLPERFADRLPRADLDGLRSMARGGEWDELLDLLVAALRATRAPVSSEERKQLHDALTGWGMSPDVLASLEVAG